MIELYATIDVDSVRPADMPADIPYMLPASSWWRKKFPAPKLAPGLRVAADCGGFVMTRKHGGYPFTPWTYDDWLSDIPGLEWAAMFDYCCEDELRQDPAYWHAPVKARQSWTNSLAAHFLENFGHRPWAWVPTVQGWETDDYKRHAEALAPLVAEFQRWYATFTDYDYAPEGSDDTEAWQDFERRAGAAAAFRVGIGTLCRRASQDQIRDIVEAVTSVLGPVPLHLWGVKLSRLSAHDLPSNVVSCDSAAWNGRIGDNIENVNAEQRRLGMTQRQYGYRIALPRYVDRFQQRVNGTRYSRPLAVRRKGYS